MTRLSVNINKVATLRNARGENNPDVVKFALHCEEVGAEGITVHPRPDERHIRRQDVRDLKKAISTEFNMEGYPSEEFLTLVEENRPAQATLVPDKPDQLTSSSGWDVIANADLLRPIIERLHKAGVRVSLFIAADPLQVRAAKEAGADRVELYTKPYADGYAADREAAIRPFVEASEEAKRIGIGMNAGHDLSLENLEFFHSRMPHLQEVSIGHALISDALYLGIDETIRRYLDCLKED
ncbi:MAG: pyridoxine 5'-phosphate synthase [Bacteroides sp.]|nr:pyridoxine 5'-phosphate synthase [Bacteroidales bacterium]MBD5296189.1 pyridoxine 5'-phosphate synthase [Bacteroides sp.]